VPTKHERRQRIIRLYREQTGIEDISMKEVARFAVKMGWQLPVPQDPLDILSKQFSESAREEIRHDKKSGNPYRANHAITVRQGNQQLTLWIDIDRAPRHKMVKSLMQRREQMIGDGLQLTFDFDHWNSVNPNEEPIKIPMDFTDDILWRKNAPKEDLKQVS
jgi:hypothetical protein